MGSATLAAPTGQAPPVGPARVAVGQVGRELGDYQCFVREVEWKLPIR